MDKDAWLIFEGVVKNFYLDFDGIYIGFDTPQNSKSNIFQMDATYCL